MPLEVVRGRGGVGEGLLAVLLGTADVHISPPSRFLAQEASPPPEVLCAFELLLREAGGVLSDACGEPIDLLAEVGRVGRCRRDIGEVGARYRSTCSPRWAPISTRAAAPTPTNQVGAHLYSSSGAGAVRSAVPLRGLMATEEHMAPYFARATRASFPAAKVYLRCISLHLAISPLYLPMSPPTSPKGEIDAFLDQLRLADKFSKGFAGEAKIVDEQGYEVRNPTPDPNQPRL